MRNIAIASRFFPTARQPINQAEPLNNLSARYSRAFAHTGKIVSVSFGWPEHEKIGRLDNRCGQVGSSERNVQCVRADSDKENSAHRVLLAKRTPRITADDRYRAVTRGVAADRDGADRCSRSSRQLCSVVDFDSVQWPTAQIRRAARPSAAVGKHQYTTLLHRQSIHDPVARVPGVDIDRTSSNFSSAPTIYHRVRTIACLSSH